MIRIWKTLKVCFFRVCFYVLKHGPVPKHIAIALDGNRRYTKKYHLQPAESYEFGWENLLKIIDWAILLEIEEFSAFAFGINNFKRMETEINTLFEVFTNVFLNLIRNRDILNARGVCICIIGDLSLVPRKLAIVVQILEWITKENKKIILNLLIAYGATDELVDVSNRVLKAVQKGKISPDEIDKTLFTNCLYTYRSSFPDIVIRTSGEKRLSDFLMWQNSDRFIYYCDVLWPEFSAWNLICAVFQYQYFVKKNKYHDSQGENSSFPENSSYGFEKFVQHEREKERRTLLPKDLDFEEMKFWTNERISDYFDKLVN